MIVLCLVAAGCSSSDSDAFFQQYRTVTRLGDTCGDWQIEPAGSPSITRVRADCADGMGCNDRVLVNPPNEAGNRLGVCLSADALTCNAMIPDAAITCPAGMDCHYGQATPAPGRCFVYCEKHSDCFGEFQVCDSTNSCAIIRCAISGTSDVGDDSKCPSGARCQRGVCVNANP